MTVLEEIVNKFVEHPSQITNGAPTLAKRWGVDLDLVYQARAIAKDILKNKEEFGTEYNPSDVAFLKDTIQGKLSEKLQEEINKLGEDTRSYLPEDFVSTGTYKDISFKITSKEAKEKLIEAITSESPNWKPKSKWQTASGEWRESYKYDEEASTSTIDFEGIIKRVFENSNIEPEFLPKVEVTTNYQLNVYLADQHIGAAVEHGLYSNYFDKHVYKDRMNKVFIEIAKLNLIYHFERINIFFLGDTFDGQDGFTVKRTHELPQNMSNEECFEVGLYTNKVFLERLFKSGISKAYGVYFVRESNHGGDMDLYLFKSLKLWIETSFPQVHVEIAKRYIDHVVLGNHTFIYTHGKDNKDMKNGLPLDLNDKTENFINQYIDYYGLKGNIRAIKGDLHQNALSTAKRFTYRNVPSLFGSSKWIMSNYGLTEPGVGIDIFSQDDKQVTSKVIDV